MESGEAASGEATLCEVPCDVLFHDAVARGDGGCEEISAFEEVAYVELVCVEVVGVEMA